MCIRDSLLGSERAVQRRLGDPGALDHAIDAHGVYAFLVEQLGRRRQQAVARRAFELHGRHTLTVQTGLSIVKATRQTCLFDRSLASTSRGAVMRLSRPAAFIPVSYTHLTLPT